MVRRVRGSLPVQPGGEEPAATTAAWTKPLATQWREQQRGPQEEARELHKGGYSGKWRVKLPEVTFYSRRRHLLFCEEDSVHPKIIKIFMKNNC